MAHDSLRAEQSFSEKPHIDAARGGFRQNGLVLRVRNLLAVAKMNLKKHMFMSNMVYVSKLISNQCVSIYNDDK